METHSFIPRLSPLMRVRAWYILSLDTCTTLTYQQEVGSRYDGLVELTQPTGKTLRITPSKLEKPRNLTLFTRRIFRRYFWLVMRLAMITHARSRAHKLPPQQWPMGTIPSCFFTFPKSGKGLHQLFTSKTVSPVVSRGGNIELSQLTNARERSCRKTVY